MEINFLEITETLDVYLKRAAEIERVGGVSFEEVIDHVKTIPDGWVADHMMGYYVPPSFLRGEGSAIQ